MKSESFGRGCSLAASTSSTSSSSISASDSSDLDSTNSGSLVDVFVFCGVDFGDDTEGGDGFEGEVVVSLLGIDLASSLLMNSM